MADKNYEQRNQSHRFEDDWQRERNRYNRENDRNPEGYGQASYGGSSRDLKTGNQGSYNRVNYFPDNDENRNAGARDYENTPYGTSGTYGYRSSGMDYNPGGYSKESRDSYLNAGNDWRNEDWNRMRNDERTYGALYGNEGEWERRNRQQSGAGNWGSDYGRQDWERHNVNTGYNSRRNDENSANRRYENRSGNDNRNRYGGDTSNFGNASQGGVDSMWWNRTVEGTSSRYTDDEDRRSREYNNGHRGKGPSNYRRSEARIREDICDRLTDDDRVDASDISVQIQDDAVILSGTVNSRDEKRRAEDLVESVSGVQNVENRLRVSGNVLQTHDYTGNTDMPGGIGRESGTTNEIIRDVENEKTSGNGRGKNKKP